MFELVSEVGTAAGWQRNLDLEYQERDGDRDDAVGG
jgi:hypothetical protein